MTFGLLPVVCGVASGLLNAARFADGCLPVAQPIAITAATVTQIRRVFFRAVIRLRALLLPRRVAEHGLQGLPDILFDDTRARLIWMHAIGQKQVGMLLYARQK